MWRPPERIRHDARPGRWPSAAEAAAARLFAPISVGPVSLLHRTWVPAMVPWRATEDGFVTRDVLDWYERFARGRPAALVVEATGIRDVPSGPLLRIGHDRFLPGLRELVEVVRRASGGETRLFIQIIDFLSIRRRPEPAKFFERYLEVTDAHRSAFACGDRCFGCRRTTHRSAHGSPGSSDASLQEVLNARELEALDVGARERVTDLHLPHIRELPQQLPGLFAEAARRARMSGFDGVELHYAHAYTMASFLSPLNTRSDGYGGTLAERARLPLEVLDACAPQSVPTMRLAVGSLPRSASRAAARRTMRSISRSSWRGQASTFCHSRAAENSTMPSSRSSVKLPTRTPDAAAMSACRRITRTRADPLAATLFPRRACARPCGPPVTRHRSSLQGACTTSNRRRPC